MNDSSRAPGWGEEVPALAGPGGREWSQSWFLLCWGNKDSETWSNCTKLCSSYKETCHSPGLSLRGPQVSPRTVVQQFYRMVCSLGVGCFWVEKDGALSGWSVSMKVKGPPLPGGVLWGTLGSRNSHSKAQL